MSSYHHSDQGQHVEWPQKFPHLGDVLPFTAGDGEQSSKRMMTTNNLMTALIGVVAVTGCVLGIQANRTASRTVTYTGDSEKSAQIKALGTCLAGAFVSEEPRHSYELFCEQAFPVSKRPIGLEY